MLKVYLKSASTKPWKCFLYKSMHQIQLCIGLRLQKLNLPFSIFYVCILYLDVRDYYPPASISFTRTFPFEILFLPRDSSVSLYIYRFLFCFLPTAEARFALPATKFPSEPRVRHCVARRALQSGRLLASYV